MGCGEKISRCRSCRCAGRVRAGVRTGADRVAGARGGLRLNDVVARRRVREGTRARIGRRRWVTTARAATTVRPSFHRPGRGGGAQGRRRRGGLRRVRACRAGAGGACRQAECRDHERRHKRARVTLAHRSRAVARRRCPSSRARQPRSTEEPTPRRPPTRRAGARSPPTDRVRRLRTACR
jgi:hypothetical protein